MTFLSQLAMECQCDNAVLVSFDDTSAYMGPTILVVPTESRKLQRRRGAFSSSSSEQPSFAKDPAKEWGRGRFIGLARWLGEMDRPAFTFVIYFNFIVPLCDRFRDR